MTITVDSIRMETAQRAPILGVYGVPGIGKTKFGSQANKPVFILAEDGLIGAKKRGETAIKVPHFPLITSYTDVLDAVKVLYTEDHGFETVVVDTLDALEPHLWAHVAKAHGHRSIEDFGYGKGLSVFAPTEWRRLKDGLTKLRDDRGMTVVLIAHSTSVRHEPPDSEPYHRYEMRLNKHANEIIEDWVDALLFANYRKTVLSEDKGFGRKHNRAVGRGERVLYTQERPSHTAKNRFALPPELPFPEDNAWDLLMNEMSAAATAAAPEPEPQPPHFEETPI